MASSMTVGILCARVEDELPALLAVFGIDQNTKSDGDLLGMEYWKTSISGRNRKLMQATIACIADSGNIAAALSTERMIVHFNPDVMLFVGIACGIRDFHLGDVVTSSLIWGYEYVKTMPKGRTLDRSHAKPVMQKLCRNIANISSEQVSIWHALFQGLQNTIPPRLPKPSEWPEKPDLHKTAWIASGEKVMGNNELARLHKSHDYIKAGEMEGLGFAQACSDQEPTIPWLVVRGISDYGDKTKDGSPEEELVKDEFHYVAALSAAAFTRVFLEKSLTLTKLNRPTPMFADRYPRSEDESFVSTVKELIPRSKKIILIGTGLNLIWREELKELLIDRAKTGQGQVTITICLGNPHSPDVKCRLREEEADGTVPPVGSEGITRLAKSVLGELKKAGDPANFQLLMFNNYPTFATLIFDEHIFFYPYGYQILGNRSPLFYLRNDGSAEAEFFVSNADRILEDSEKATDVIDKCNTNVGNDQE